MSAQNIGSREPGAEAGDLPDGRMSQRRLGAVSERSRVLRVAVAQTNLVVGDLSGNVAKMKSSLEAARRLGADVVAFPELAVTGYPPEDLVLRPRFVSDNLRALRDLASAVHGCVALVGYVDRSERGLHNAVAVCADGEVKTTVYKRHLPNYAVFDEARYFVPGDGPPRVFAVAGVPCAVTVCEDAWVREGPVAAAARAGAACVFNLNASPYHRGKVDEREQMLAERVEESGAAIVYANLVGGQDELVFDGASMVYDRTGAVVGRAPQFREDLLVVDLDVGPSTGAVPVEFSFDVPAREKPSVGARFADRLHPLEEVYEALVLGTRDYVEKNGFGAVVVGVSGGIDSSLVATLAVDAMGPDRVHTVAMPSRYSSAHSLEDAAALARSLAVDHRVIPIEPAHRAFEEMLPKAFADARDSTAAENVQSRIRGVILMTLSNAYGWLVLTTGNKSEMAVGYATLYGDMAGGFAVIKDVPKTLVYELARWRNEKAGRYLIPRRVFEKPPSAELRPGQLDTDSLPPYEKLDPVLECYVERDMSVADLVEAGFDPDLVRRVARMVDRNEYKRRQAPPGPRVTTKAFGKDRRLPITNHYVG
ncbi:MAG: NAD+ synthase [Acidimicrobiales bacterium]|nr:MAG: NAD+ synthase [Acidimicrobiales bacterium]